MSDVFDRLYNKATAASRGQRTVKYESPSNNTTEWKRPNARPSSPTALPVFQNPSTPSRFTPSRENKVAPPASPEPELRTKATPEKASREVPVKKSHKKKESKPKSKPSPQPEAAQIDVTKSPKHKKNSISKESKATLTSKSKDDAKSEKENAVPMPETVIEIEIPPKEEYLKQFDRIDMNGNGILSLAELDKAVIQLWPEFNNKPAIMRAYKASDRDNDGFIRRNEFGFFLRYIVYYNNLWQHFESTDADGDRRLSKEEFAVAAPKLGISNAEEFFVEMDSNQGGYVLFDEFCAKMAMRGEIPDASQKIGKESGEDHLKSKSQSKDKGDAQKKVDPVPEAVMTIEIPPKEECLKTFDGVDMNGNGILSLAELDKAVIEMWPEFNNKPAIMRAYKASDRDDNGFIRRNEFGFFLRYIVYYNNLWQYFESTDADGDRRLSKEEFVLAAPKLGISNAEEFFVEMDSNQGGYVLFDEFCAKMAMRGEIPDASQKIVKESRDGQSQEKDKGEPEESIDPVPKVVMSIEVPPKEEYLKQFDSIDMNGNGILSLAELDKAVIEMWPEFNNKPAIMRAYKASDRDNNGFIRRDEFGFFLRYIVYYNNLWQYFESTDADGDRRLSKEEFVLAAPKLGISNAEEFFVEMDSNGGGYVLFDEFCATMAMQADSHDREKSKE